MRDDLDLLGRLLRQVEDAIAAVEATVGFVQVTVEMRAAAGLDTAALETRLAVADEGLGSLHAHRRRLIARHNVRDGGPVLRVVG
jgi:hypothetical protein